MCVYTSHTYWLQIHSVTQILCRKQFHGFISTSRHLCCDTIFSEKSYRRNLSILFHAIVRESNEEKTYFVLFCFNVCKCVLYMYNVHVGICQFGFYPRLHFIPLYFIRFHCFNFVSISLSLVAVCLLCVYVRLINPCIGKLSVDAHVHLHYTLKHNTQHISLNIPSTTLLNASL